MPTSWSDIARAFNLGIGYRTLYFNSSKNPQLLIASTGFNLSFYFPQYFPQYDAAIVEMPGAGEERIEEPDLNADGKKAEAPARLVLSHQSGGDEACLVNWESDDKENPHNWSTLYRSWLTFQLGMLALSASLASAIIAPANLTIARYLDISREVVTLNVSLYVYV